MKKTLLLLLTFLSVLNISAGEPFRKLASSGMTIIDNGDKVTFSENMDNMNLYLKNGSAWSGNVSLTKPFGESVTVDKGELHFNFNNSSSDYVSIEVPIQLNENATLGVYTSRYTYWMSPVTGNGTINFYGGGERSYLGNAKGAAFPDWTNFTGNLNIYQDKSVIGTCGFYGVVLGHGNTTFYPEEVESCLNEGKYSKVLENCSTTVTSGATIACEAGTRAFRIGHLFMEENSRLIGYYKKDGKSRSYFVIGGDGENSVLKGTISPADATNALGLIKEGKGTYTITGKQNSINAGVRVMKGAVYVDGNTGSASSGATVTVCPKALFGGVGNVEGSVALYGNLRPGNDNSGTLTIGSNKSGQLLIAPTAKLLFRIGNDKNDMLDVKGGLDWTGKNFDFTTSDQLPVIKPVITDEASFVYTPGAEYVLIKSLVVAGSGDAASRDFRIANPDPTKWNVIRTTDDAGYEYYILKAEPSTNPNDIAYDLDDDLDDDDDEEYNLADFNFTMQSDRKSLREYAEKVGKKIGVAVPVYKMNIDNATDSRTLAITKNFNICVAENEMKIDALQPNQGKFEFYNADKLVNLAMNNNMRVRGHTLVWHQQVPEWISSDGKKNDKGWTRQEALDIMKKHITTVMQHFKGKVYEWDVVNEMLDDDQSVVRTNPDGYNLRSNVWYKAIGEDYVDSALVYAHRADPEAKLYINEYGAEMYGSAKTEAYFNLAKRLVKSGMPLDGVGLQCHLTVGELSEKKFDANVARYADLNINCIVTELDMSIADFNDPEHYNRQALEYYKIVKTMLKYDHFPHLIVWGVTDDLSWRGGEPLLFNSNVGKKPAYWALRNAVRDYYLANDIAIPEIDKNANNPQLGEKLYNLSGQRVGNDYKGIVVSNGLKYIRR